MGKIISILVTGGSGQLGRSILKITDYYPDYQFFFPTREQLDFTNSKGIDSYFNNHNFDIIINCAAYTSVDKAELETSLANQVNHLAVEQLANFANKQKAKLVHISTDYVFPGTNFKPYVEDDEVDPQGIYGLTKLKGEQAIQSIMVTNAIIIRTSWVYSEYGSNFVKTMLKLGQERDNINVISDQLGTPTYAHDLSLMIMTIIQSENFAQAVFKSSLYHFSNEGVCSWYDFSKAIFELAGIVCRVKPIETKEYSSLVARPYLSILNKAEIKNIYSLTIPYWRDSLKQCLEQLQDKK